MHSLILFLPLMSSVICGLMLRGNSYGKTCGVLSSLFIGLAAFLSWVSFFIFGGGTFFVPLFDWISTGSIEIVWGVWIDRLTLVMLVVVNTISFLVHVYSIGYMSQDDSQPRFFCYLSLFTFMMLMLVTSGNFLQLFFGWEGVGLSSYLLIGFWHHKASANSAAIKAFVVNRVGDLGLIVGILGIYWLFGSLDFEKVFSQAGSVSAVYIDFLGIKWHALTIISLLLFAGAMGKSAQFLLHTWLPDAMEGPTPVSALIHAATMVTAGVFLLARCSPLFELSSDARSFVMLVGATTAFFAATIGLVQYDIKRVIAYSTCSQLGYMFVALGAGAYQAGIFHLFTHAFFKALLFLGSGSVIHALGGEQDMRKMGGIYRKLPLTWVFMLIGTLSLTGFPLLAGYFSKDVIIEVAYLSGGLAGEYAFALILFTAFLTAFYSWRLIFLTFHGNCRVSPEVMNHIHESPKVMLVPLFLLSLGSIFSGLIFVSYFVGDGNVFFWKEAIFSISGDKILNAIHNLPLIIVLSPFILMSLGFVLAFYAYIINTNFPLNVSKVHAPLYSFFYNKWYFDLLYDNFLVKGVIYAGRFCWRSIDLGLIDRLGPDGISKLVMFTTNQLVKLQSGYIYHYAFSMVAGLTLLLTWFLLRGF